MRWRNLSKFGGGAEEVLALLALGSSGPCAVGSCLGDVKGADLGACKVVFLAVDFRLRLGLVGAIKGDPYSLEAISEPLAGVLSAEESMSCTRMGSSLDNFTGLKVL